MPGDGRRQGPAVLQAVRQFRGGTAVEVELEDGRRQRVSLRELRAPSQRDDGRLRIQGIRTGQLGDPFEVMFSDGATVLYGVDQAGRVRRAGRARSGGGRDLLVRNIGQLVTCAPAFGYGQEGAEPEEQVGAVHEAALVIAGGVVVWSGANINIPDGVVPAGADELDAGGACVIPGLVDAHNHLVFAGDRSAEYARRLAGADYREILAAGGGILSTVEKTRAAPAAVLTELARGRLDRLLSFGVTTTEAKSGYGLNRKHEQKLLEVIRTVGESHPVEVIPTFLGAHAIPSEARTSPRARADYVSHVCNEMIPSVVEGGLARFCDVFVDDGAYTLEEGRAVLMAARKAGLRLKIHAEEFAATGAAAMAAELGAVSADHLEQIDDLGIGAMALAGTVAVLLPGTATVLGLEAPPVAALRRAGVAIALGTDFNPGTCFSENLSLMVGLACAHFGMSAEEGLLGVTRHAARALGVEDRCGHLEVGALGDLVVLDAPDYRHLAYHLGVPLAAIVVKEGSVVYRA